MTETITTCPERCFPYPQKLSLRVSREISPSQEPSSFESNLLAQQRNASFHLPPSPTLVSPTVMAVQDYYTERGLPGANAVTALANWGQTPTDRSRRHSVLVTPSILAASLALVDLRSNPSSPASSSRRGSAYSLASDEHIADLGTLARENRQWLLQRSGPSQSNNSGNQSPIQNPLNPQLLGSLPFGYTHDRLKKWGTAYWGNEATADAFVRAVPLHRSDSQGNCSSSIASESSAVCPSPMDPSLMTLHVRVHPLHTSRKPFSLRKKFNIAGFRSTPKSASGHPSHPNSHLRNTRRRSTQLSVSQISTPLRRATGATTTPEAQSNAPEIKPEPRDDSIKDLPNILPSSALPIHIEYALYRLPLLAAVMLSGYILRGDAIELPLPRPEAWPKVVEWMYVGAKEEEASAGLAEDVLENIRYLAGILD
ncbi:MAG: hypothetical protein M1817_000380 [Caeruleum heppii]|nr:MAG: hypothetical protein M1817_000380 [Caeruleum heppii]